jgi:hypothetical protein
MHKEDFAQGVDGDRHILGQSDAFQSGIQLSQKVWLAKEQGKNGILIFCVWPHRLSIGSMGFFFNGKVTSSLFSLSAAHTSA